MFKHWETEQTNTTQPWPFGPCVSSSGYSCWSRAPAPAAVLPQWWLTWPPHRVDDGWWRLVVGGWHHENSTWAWKSEFPFPSNKIMMLKFLEKVLNLVEWLLLTTLLFCWLWFYFTYLLTYLLLSVAAWNPTPVDYLKTLSLYKGVIIHLRWCWISVMQQ